MYAHYFKSGPNHFLIISKDTRPTGERIVCTSKADVKAEAKARNLTPWNY